MEKRKFSKNNKIKKVFISLIKGCILVLPAFLTVLPIIMLLSGSVMDSYEMSEYLKPLIATGTDFITWRWVPKYPSFSNYGKLLFFTPQFYILFWNSIFMVCIILIGQLVIGIPAAWAFAVYESKKSKWIFAIYVVLMLIPFQVMMMSNYLVLQRLSLLNTYGAVILPAIFSTFPIFLSYGSFHQIPEELLEAARMDGAGEIQLFIKIGLPLGKGGLLSAMVLGFLEYWNMMEQPMAFLEDKRLWPLSLYLPQISISQAGFAFCASIITLIPALFVFVLGQDYLEQGIIYSGLKA